MDKSAPVVRSDTGGGITLLFLNIIDSCIIRQYDMVIIHFFITYLREDSDYISMQKNLLTFPPHVKKLIE